MSGTSADAIDLALVECKGAGIQTKITLIESVEISWPTSLRADFFALAYRPDAPIENILELDRALSDFFSEEISKVVKEWKKGRQIDLIGFAGQTVFHRGAGKDHKPLTFQLGNPAQLARKTGLPVIADFRKDHIALGYEGAPLSPLAEVLLYSSTVPRATLNLGGIANITLLPGTKTKDNITSNRDSDINSNSDSDITSSRDSDSVLKCDSDSVPIKISQPAIIPYSTDAGPANTVMDQLVRRVNPGQTFDKDGALASKGKVIPALLNELLQHPYFHKPKPCSTGPEEFTLQWLDSAVESLRTENPEYDHIFTLENKLRTLCEVTAISVARVLIDGYKRQSTVDEQISTEIQNSSGINNNSDSSNQLKIPLYVSGGGAKNPVVMEALLKYLRETPFEVKPTDEIGVDSDMKEAILFAVLANERVAGYGWIDPLRQNEQRFRLGSFYFPQ
jgi:anhydro-N-acetylmuramic acid kinase